DFDMDMWGTLMYIVTPSKVYMTSVVVYQSTIFEMGFGYVLGGTRQDGFHVHSGVNGYAYNDPTPGALMVGSPGTTDPNSGTQYPYCVNCGPVNETNGVIYWLGPAIHDNATTVAYDVGASTATTLQQPLWYAAKWGGFLTANGDTAPSNTDNNWDANQDGIPDHYFYATNPVSLSTSLARAFNDTLGTVASQSAIAVSSPFLPSTTTATTAFIADYDSSDWSGDLFAFALQANGTIAQTGGSSSLNAGEAIWDAANNIPTSRNIYTITTTTNAAGQAVQVGIPFQWPTTSSTTAGLSNAQILALDTGLGGSVGTDALGQLRLNWLRGDTSHELRNTGGIFRNRTRTVLGDIVNSSPVYTQSEDDGFGVLPATAPEQANGGYAAYVAAKANRTPMVYVGANDGMLHGFRADTGVEQFAYIPNAVFNNLSGLTDPSYMHRYFVDGAPTVSDAYLGHWATVLVGGLNAGGNAIYASHWSY
ncbi:MAG: PilC/PilY family type IV pilus protein, partial [Methylomonas sp.]